MPDMQRYAAWVNAIPCHHEPLCACLRLLLSTFLSASMLAVPCMAVPCAPLVRGAARTPADRVHGRLGPHATDVPLVCAHSIGSCIHMRTVLHCRIRIALNYKYFGDERQQLAGWHPEMCSPACTVVCRWPPPPTLRHLRGWIRTRPMKRTWTCRLLFISTQQRQRQPPPPPVLHMTALPPPLMPPASLLPQLPLLRQKLRPLASPSRSALQH
jgi:hypothetical protein